MSVVANVAINVDAKNAIQQLNRVDAAAKGTQQGFNTAALGAKGLGAAIQASLGPLIAFTAAAEAVKKSLETAFARGAAEQRLKNLTSSTKEFETATALAANAANQFGLTQTQATEAFADAYGRLSGLGYGLKEVNDIYSGFNVVAKQAGVSSEDAAGSFLQLSQAMGKGVLNGDELAIILERMPQLGALLAKEMGVSAGSIKQLGSEGKITGDVIYRALEQASSSAGELGSNLNAQQQAFASLNQVADQLFNSLGQALGPVVVAGAELLAKAGQEIADRWNYVANVLFPQVVQAIEPLRAAIADAIDGFDFSVINTAIQNVFIKGFQVGIAVVNNLSKVLAFVIDKFKELSNNPVFKFIAEQVGRLANFLGLTTNHVAEYKKEQEGAAQAAAKNANEFSKLPPKAIDLKAKQAAIKEELKSQLAVLNNINAVEAARGQAKQQILNAETQGLELQKQVVLSLNEEYAINNEIASKKIAAANESYAQAARELNLKVRQAEIEFESIQASYKQGTATEKQVQKAKENLQTITQVRDETLNGAEATRSQAVAAADLERRQQNVAAYAADAARQTEAFNRAANEAVNALNNQVKVADAIAQTQTTLNNLEIQSLQNKLGQARTDGERLDIIEKIRSLEIANAAIVLQNTRTQINAEVERQRIALKIAEVKYQELRAVVEIAKAQGVINHGYLEALRAQESALRIAKDNYSTSIQVATEQWRAADATYNAAVQAAKFKASMEGTAAAAGEVANSVERAASAMQRQAGGGYLQVENIQNPLLRQQAEGEIEMLRKQVQGKTDIGSQLQFMNDMQDVVLKYTQLEKQARVEQQMASAAQELESLGLGFYVPPQYKTKEDTQDLFAKYGSSASPQATSQSMSPQVNISTGPVMQMDGTNYVTQRDLVTATGEAARQGADLAMQRLQNNPSSRRSTGLTR